MSAPEQLAKLLGVGGDMLRALDREMAARGSVADVSTRTAAENAARVAAVLESCGLTPSAPAAAVQAALRKRVLADEKDLLAFLATEPGSNEFERAASLARRITRVETGFFLKRDRAAAVLEERKPNEVLRALGAKTVRDALASHDVLELMNALRFLETDAWMHQTFDACYRRFTEGDFEERPIEVRVLGPAWREVAKRFVEKKHHNVSHLKEFGVIFLNPISEDVPGALLRDFALLLHYFHEIEFYASLFRNAVGTPNFADRFASLLRGDVPERYRAEPGEWLIVQRYLAKIDPNDPRLLLPRVNPESLHWRRAERDLTSFAREGAALDFSFWNGLDWVGGVFGGETVSFDLEDSAMSAVAAMQGKSDSFTYHEREALWLELFTRYAGNEEKVQSLLVENFDRGVIQF